MTDRIEIIKSDDIPVQKPRIRQGWTDDVELADTKVNILSPGLGHSSDGDRSPAYSEPIAVLSPQSGALSPTIEFQHSKSFDSSSISSKSSKKTSISADLIRQRVRQQARSLVDKKRGSVQLAKRLLRSQTLQSTELPFSPDDYEAADRQLESSLQIGAKYITKENTTEAPDYIQHRFFQANPIEEKKEISGALVVFTKPKNTIKQRAEFSSLLTIHRPINTESIEDPIYRLDPQTFRTKSGRDFRLILSRHGDRFASETHGIKGLEPMISKKIDRLVREEDEDFALVEYRYPENWSDWIDRGGSLPKKYFQFNIDLNHLEFDHHWLFSQEDAIARRLRNLHSIYVDLCERLVQMFKEYAELKQRVEIEVVGEEEQTRIDSKLVQLRDQIGNLKDEMPKIGTLMEATYEALKQIWQTSGINTTNYRLEKFIGEPIEDDPNGEFAFHTYILKHLHPKNENENQTEPSRVVLSQKRTAQEQLQKLDQERRMAIEKCRLRVRIYFNDILVCKTDEVPLSWDFTANFEQVYNLKVYEQPETVLLIVSEKFEKYAWRDLAKIYVPFVLGADFELQPMEFASELTISSFKNSLGCGELPRSPHLNGKLFCNAVWLEGGSMGITMKDHHTDSLAYQNTFNLIPLETMLGHEDHFQSDARLEALYRRYKNKNYSKGKTRRIGLHSSEIDHQSFLADDWQTELNVDMSELSLDSFHEMGYQYAISVRNNLMETATFKRRNKSYHDIVREDSIPVLFNFIGTLFRPPDLSRKLKPMRNQQRAKAPLHAKHKIVINIQSATNLPEKVNGEPTNIFVDILFRKQRLQTVAVEGRYANWQETVILEVERENNLHFDLANLNDQFEFRLYDRILSALDFDNRETNTIHEQVENRFLAYTSVPFSTVYALGKVDGTISIQKPLFHTDYKNMEKQSQLKVLITSDPPLLPPQLHLNECLMDGENIQIINECMQWYRKCCSRFPDRIYYALVNDTNGKSTLTINYIQPIAPPQMLRECASDNALRGCQFAAHIVSCIPIVMHPVVCSYSTNIWMTIEQILTIGCGSVEEHAILLVDWLLGMGYTAALVLGRSLPEGTNAAYVLVEIDNSPSYLINPCNANRYQLDDTNCPLFQVCTVITPTNVFGNIQPIAHCSQMEFNFSRRQHWEPLFTDKRSNFTSVQKGSIVYTDVSDDLVMELRTSLEREIRVKFDQNRPYGIPQWNVLASRALREVLAELSSDLVEPKQVDVRNKFNQLGIPYEFSALALQRGYSTKNQLLNDVLNTQVHVNANPLAQFAFAVHTTPYFNNIVSCSLAIACLQPNT